jgi:hypothetical protein
MPAIVGTKFRIHNAQSFIEGFDEAVNTNLYLFIGKYLPWTKADLDNSYNSGSSADDTNPPTPRDNVGNMDFQLWKDMIAAKKIQGSDVKQVIPRYNWKSGTVYTMYDHKDDSLLTNSTNPFYVVTDEFKVYKCLYAPTSDGLHPTAGTNVASIIKPADTTDAPFFTSDGYCWQYMYTITPADTLKFVTNNHMAVESSATITPTNGKIDAIKLVTEGTNYLYKDGIAESSADNGANTEVVLPLGSSGNDDYYNGYTLYYSGTLYDIIDYVGASRTATLGGVNLGGAVGGQPIEVAPKINISGDGSGAQARFVVSSDALVTSGPIEIINTGIGYTEATVTITVSGGVGDGATAEAMIGPVGGHGSNPAQELGGFFVMMDVRLENDEGSSELLTIGNDYRQIGLLKDPLDALAATATDALYNQLVHIRVTNIFDGPYQADEIVTGGTSGATGRVVDQITVSDHPTLDEGEYIRLASVSGTFVAGEQLTGGTSGATLTTPASDNVEVLPQELQAYSGEIIYIENRKPIARAIDQIENIKIILEH